MTTSMPGETDFQPFKPIKMEELDPNTWHLVNTTWVQGRDFKLPPNGHVWSEPIPGQDLIDLEATP